MASIDMEISRPSLRPVILPAVILTVFASSNALGEDRDLKQRAADHRAKVERSIAESRERMERKRDEMRLRHEETARDAAARRAEVEQEAAERRAEVERSMAATRERMRERREAQSEKWEAIHLEQAERSEEIQQAAAEDKQRKTWYWAKQFGLLGTIIAAGIGQAVAVRRKRNETGPNSGRVAKSPGPSGDGRPPNRPPR